MAMPIQPPARPRTALGAPYDGWSLATSLSPLTEVTRRPMPQVKRARSNSTRPSTKAPANTTSDTVKAYRPSPITLSRAAAMTRPTGPNAPISANSPKTPTTKKVTIQMSRSWRVHTESFFAACLAVRFGAGLDFRAVATPQRYRTSVRFPCSLGNVLPWFAHLTPPRSN